MDFFFFKRKSRLTSVVLRYIPSDENSFSSYGYQAHRFRCDSAGKNISAELWLHSRRIGIDEKPSSGQLASKNGLVERLEQEKWTQARVMLFGSTIPPKTWADAPLQANWLRNRLPSSPITGKIPIKR